MYENNHHNFYVLSAYVPGATHRLAEGLTVPGKVRKLGWAECIQTSLQPVQGGLVPLPAASLNVSGSGRHTTGKGLRWARPSCSRLSTEWMKPGLPPPRARWGLSYNGTPSMG